MSDAWKRLERETAKELKGERRKRGGDFSVSGSDVIHPLFEIECKKRKTISPFGSESLKSVTEATLYSKRTGYIKVPLGVCQTPGRPLKLCYIRLQDMVDLISRGIICLTNDIIIGIKLGDLGGCYNDDAKSREKFIEFRRDTKGKRDFQGKKFRKRKKVSGSSRRGVRKSRRS